MLRLDPVHRAPVHKLLSSPQLPDDVLVTLTPVGRRFMLRKM